MSSLLRISHFTHAQCCRQRLSVLYRWRSNSNLAGIPRGQLQHRPPLAFAFDIDGVLLRGDDVIPQAKKALNMLNGENALGIKIPFILITNGGGSSERLRCKMLTEKLGVEIKLQQFMQAHTVLKSIVNEYADKTVLVLGGKPGAVPAVAKEYGFKTVVTTLDILAWNKSVWPLHDLDPAERAFVESRPPFDPSTRISAVFVFHDPRNWALDVQVVSDIIRFGGYVLPANALPSTASRPLSPNEPVKLVFCNPDLLWGSDYPASRIGQGAFRVAFQAVFKALTGHEYPHSQYGKPTIATYNFAENLLREQLKLLREYDSRDGYTPNVYMVGDNPESDIAGANANGWSSVLVETGVYDPNEGPPAHTPTHVATDVEGAVKWAIDREVEKLKTEGAYAKNFV